MQHKGVSMLRVPQVLRKPYLLIIVAMIGMPGSQQLKAQRREKGPSFVCDMSVMTAGELVCRFSTAPPTERPLPRFESTWMPTPPVAG